MLEWDHWFADGAWHPHQFISARSEAQGGGATTATIRSGHPTPETETRAETIDEEAAAFKKECLAVEAMAERVLTGAESWLAWQLFAWLHSSDNPSRCTKDHGATYSQMWGQAHDTGKKT